MLSKIKFNELSCIRLCFTAAPFLTVLMLLDTAILVMSPLLKIYATAEFIDASIRLLSEEAPLTDALFPIAVVVLVSGYSCLEKSLRSIVAIFTICFPAGRAWRSGRCFRMALLWKSIWKSSFRRYTGMRMAIVSHCILAVDRLY